MIGQRQMTMEDVSDILRRRLWWIVVPFVIGPLVALGIALMLTSKYTSDSLVMIEQQSVPDSVVKSVVDENLVARLATMQEQVESRNSLSPLITKYELYKNLYKDDATRQTSMDDMVDLMRKAISVTPVSSVVDTKTAGKKEEDIPGFDISFTYDNPKLAQQVCADLTSSFIHENLVTREKSAESTTNFLDQQVQDAKRKLDDQDAKLAQLQKKYLGALPDDERNNLTLLSTVNTQLDTATQSLSRAQQDRAYTEALLMQQLNAWNAYRTVMGSPNSHPETTDKEIAALEDRLTAMQARYTPDHPDVVKLKAMIEDLKKSRTGGTAPMVTAAADNSTDKSPADPSKGKTVADTSASKAGGDKSGAKAPANNSTAKTQPPSVLEPKEIQQLRSQLHALDEAIVNGKREQARLLAQGKTYESRMQMSPIVEQEYNAIMRDHKTALDFYNDLLAKKNASSMASQLESSQQGEQMTLLDPATLPTSPSFPNYLLFGGGGAGGGIALGFALVFLFELRDKAIRFDRDIEYFLELPTLVMLPSIGEDPRKKKKKNGRWRFWAKKAKPAPEHPVAA